ncbi:MAG TPA: transglycosylase SLT domain-containing protein [Candidatus Binataceae bacterium]|nr:transglycosylase SLT domain-containing protein [Candidatus Binataceae bacterium]
MLHARASLHLMAGVLLLGGCAAPPAAIASGAQAPLQTATQPAQMAASTFSQPTVPEAHSAFLDGYHAYLNRDYSSAERQLGAASGDPALADWALYFLGCAQRDSGDQTNAAATFGRLVTEFPDSAQAGAGRLELARAQLALGHNGEAAATAAGLIARGPETDIESQARLIEAKALAASGNSGEAYARAMELRDKFPRAAVDSDARALAYAQLATNPALADTSSLDYLKAEAALLLREGEPTLALAAAKRGLAVSPPVAVRAELVWLEAQALRGNPDREKRALLEYLTIAPSGPSAPAAFETLALMYWRDEDYDQARAIFGRIVSSFPHSPYAPGAMQRIGRIFEETQKFDSARLEYQRLIARYPSSEAADEARFRAPWMYYMTHRYGLAADGFKAARVHASSPGDRDMYDYWQARALEHTGDGDGARELYARVASSIDSNYYPALAARHVDSPAPDLPAARAQDPSLYPLPVANREPIRFHLDRALAFRALGLGELESVELQVLADHAESDASLRQFVLAGFQSAGQWYEAILAATHMVTRGKLPSDVGERVRYPLAFPKLLREAAAHQSLDPYLVISLTRQESLFNPNATSVSDARGLMQLLPSTGARIAGETGIADRSADLYDPSTNVALGTAYLRLLLEQFSGDEFKAIAAYNGGEHAVEQWTIKFPGDDDEWVENIGYKETREYVKKVVGGKREYRLLYGASSNNVASRNS